MKQLSKITDGLIGQPMFKLLVKVNALEKAGKRIFHFEIGDTDFKAYQHVVDATKRALDNDQTHYVDSMGIPELRRRFVIIQKIVWDLSREINQVLIMPSNSIIDFVMRCIANPGGRSNLS